MDLHADATCMLTETEMEKFLDKNTFINLIMAPYLEMSLFFEGITSIFRVTLSKKMIKRIRNDKFCIFLPPFLPQINHVMVRGPLTRHHSIHTLKDYAYLNLERVLELSLPSYLELNNSLCTPSYFFMATEKTVAIKDRRHLSQENINDWLLASESILLSQKSVNNEERILLEIYASLAIHTIFDGNLEGSKQWLDKINSQFEDFGILNS